MPKAKTKTKETVEKVTTKTKKKPVIKETKPKKEVTKKLIPEQKETKKEESVFVSMCGAKFNASPDSTCFLMCRNENKDSFHACLTHSEKVLETKVKRLKRRKKNIDYFGDGIGTSASMINELLVCGASIDEMKEELELKESRIRGHFNGLRTQGIKTRPKPFSLFKDKETKRWFFDEPDLPFYGHCNECGNVRQPVPKKTKKKAAKGTARA